MAHGGAWLKGFLRLWEGGFEGEEDGGDVLERRRESLWDDFEGESSAYLKAKRPTHDKTHLWQRLGMLGGALVMGEELVMLRHMRVWFRVTNGVHKAERFMGWATMRLELGEGNVVADQDKGLLLDGCVAKLDRQ